MDNYTTPKNTFQNPPSKDPHSKTSLPIDSVPIDQLPQEKGWSLKEINEIVGGLYLNSYHRASAMEEQFNSILSTLKQTVSSLEQNLKFSREETSRLNDENARLKRELTILNKSSETTNNEIASSETVINRTPTISSDDK